MAGEVLRLNGRGRVAGRVSGGAGGETGGGKDRLPDRLHGLHGGELVKVGAACLGIGAEQSGHAGVTDECGGAAGRAR